MTNYEFRVLQLTPSSLSHRVYIYPSIVKSSLGMWYLTVIGKGVGVRLPN